jgi:hypothetical protein
MSMRYRMIVAHSIGSDGCPAAMTQGHAVEINGKAYVEMPYGNITPDDGFHATPGEARLAAALEIEQLAHRLITQADKLRLQAAKEVAA